MNKQHRNVVSTIEAVCILVTILTIIAVSLIMYEAAPHVPIFLVVILLIIYTFVRRIPWKETEFGMIEGVKKGIIPIFIFILIGVLISSWMSAGTIPTLIYYSFKFVSVEWFLPSVLVVTAVIGMCLGSSLTTASTLGVAFMALGGLLGFNPAVVAGAVVSGAMFGDKISPLSDTTNLASSVSDVDLFEHIRHMLWTAIPAFLISLFLFGMIGGSIRAKQNPHMIEEWMELLIASTNVHILALLPALVIMMMAVKRVPAIPTMITGITIGLIVSIMMQPYGAGEYVHFIQDGFSIETGSDDLDEMLTRGGIQSMMWSISLLLLTLIMGGILSVMGVFEKLIHALSGMVKTRFRLVLSTVCTGMGINVFLGEQYMSVILNGEAYKLQYERLGLKKKNLSRVLENAGTVINPLIPYGVIGVFMTSVLEVNVLEYFPYAFFCLLCPILVLFYGWTGMSMTKEEK